MATFFYPGTRVQMDGLEGTVVEREPRTGHTPVLWDLYQKVTYAPTRKLEAMIFYGLDACETF